ncbi:hypothetical protein TraAM80_01378 [Trypanosoma rangeli]|uniref:Uncharacterized protein n=1 Tax=Trypanosoma rangeli TaxID=5698 RepID=A0A3S5ISE7_TRYRA|nr:uncharacterized protein TraAM80_01378 [Trypanosoma rangeli]RNF10832.1 hypothetical protein TraAM80_01378 [Trypanosoma rangeli]|eukprot:RNF10832.1 hypothetical protein TraAM80_01378 [Trypanosoma rangeli]
MTAAVGALPPLGAVSAIDRLQEAKRRFALVESYSALSRSPELLAAAPRPIVPQQRACLSSSLVANAATAMAGGKQERARGTVPHVSGLSSIRRHSAGESETNSVLTWNLLNSNCRNSPTGAALAAAGVGSSPAAASSWVAGSEEAGSNSPPTATALDASTGTGNAGVFDEAVAMPTASRGQKEHCAGDMETHDFYRRRHEAQRMELVKREGDCRRRRDTCRAAVKQIISHSMRLAYAMELQRRTYNEVMRRVWEPFTFTEPTLTPAAVPPRHSKLSQLFSPPEGKTRGAPDGSTPAESGAQIALKMLKFKFMSDSSPSTSTSSKPPCVKAAVPVLEAEAPAAVESPSGVTALSAEEVLLNVNEANTNVDGDDDDEYARKRCSSTEEVAAVSPPVDHGEFTSFYPSLATEAATASTEVYNSRIRHTREQNNKEKGLAADTQLPALGRGCLTGEEQRALKLLSTVCVLRRQTEELTVAVLHTAGEWGCWESTGASNFRGLFLSPNKALCIPREEEEVESLLAASKEAKADVMCPVTAALKHQCLFRRLLPPPPPVSVQLEAFKLSGMRLQRIPGQDQRRQRQRQQEAGLQTTVTGYNDREALMDGEACLRPVTATAEKRREEQEKFQNLVSCLDLRRFRPTISSSSTSTSASSPLATSSSAGSLYSSSTCSESPTASGSHVDLTASSTSSTFSSTEVTTTVETWSGEDGNTNVLLRSNTREEEDENADERKGVKGRDNLLCASHQGGPLPVGPPEKFTSFSVAPRMAEDFNDTAFIPIFHAEEISNRSRRRGGKTRDVAKRILSFFSFGACCGGGGRGATVSGRKQDNPTLLREKETRR